MWPMLAQKLSLTWEIGRVSAPAQFQIRKHGHV